MKAACSIAQGFGGNANPSYQGIGLKGHTGVDNDCGYGSEIRSYFDKEYVYKVLTREHPSNDGTGFTGVFTIIDNGIEVFEFLYGHCNPNVSEGQILTKGTVLGTQGNNGLVYDGSIQITLQMQKNGDHRGSHRHDQKRILRKDKTLQPNTQYVSTKTDGYYQDEQGYYYAIPYYNNGYNGCVNWLLPLFNRNLTLGMSGYDVQCLQNFLKARGFFQGDVTQFFGPKTMAAVSAWQKANGISPVLGFFGPASRNLANNELQ